MVTDYERVAVVVPKELKRAMIDYSSKTGRNLTWVVNTLLGKLLRDEINLDDTSKPNFSDRAKAATKRVQP
jgi:hypothetical protein